MIIKIISIKGSDNHGYDFIYPKWRFWPARTNKFRTTAVLQPSPYHVTGYSEWSPNNARAKRVLYAAQATTDEWDCQ